MLQTDTEPVVAKFCFAAAENELSEVEMLNNNYFLATLMNW